MKTEQIQKIGLSTAIIICMNAMIGAGIFTTPAKLATSVGPAGILSYAFVVIAVLFMALSLARVAQIYPQEGSFYTYTKQWAGHFGGILAAGAYVIGISIAMGLLAKIAGNYVSIYTGISAKLASVIIVSFLTALNMAGIKMMEAGQFFLICCTLFSMISTIVICLLNANTGNLVPFAPFGWESALSATKIAIFAFFGFESAASLYSIVENPSKNVPRALTLSIVIVGILYLTFISSIILAIPSVYFPDSTTPLSQAIINVFPRFSWLGHVIGISIITALLGVIQSMLYSVATLIISFFRLLKSSWSNKISENPSSISYVLLSLGSAIIFCSIIFESIDLLFGLTAIFIMFAFIMSLLVLPIKRLNKTITEKIVSVLGLITAFIIFFAALKDFILAIK